MVTIDFNSRRRDAFRFHSSHAAAALSAQQDTCPREYFYHPQHGQMLRAVGAAPPYRVRLFDSVTAAIAAAAEGETYPEICRLLRQLADAIEDAGPLEEEPGL